MTSPGKALAAANREGEAQLAALGDLRPGSLSTQ